MTSIFKKWSKGLCCNALSGDALPPAFLFYNITKIVLRLSTVGRAIEAHRPFAGVTNSPETVCCGLLCVFQMIMIRCAEHHGPYGEKTMGLYKHRQTRYHLMDMKLIHIHISKIVYYTAGICAIMQTTDTVI